MNNANSAVVVGVDGSDIALGAVRVAASEATRRGRSLHIVHAFVWPMLRVPVGPPPGGPAEGGLRNQAERVLADAVAEANAAQPGLEVSAEIVEGQPAAVLLGQAHDAALLVIGDRGLGGFAGLLVGSVAIQVAEYATCPVLVIRGEQRPEGPVIVGVDGSARSAAAVEFAAEEAALRGAELVAVHAYWHPVSLGPGDIVPLVYDEDALQTEEAQLLAESVAGLAERYPDLRITQRLVRGKPATALIEESADAQLVVVGARGRGGFAGLLLGSVSQSVLHHSKCPVIVIRHAD
ncbi:universal stress protein [Micromonospora sonneratiae]|uniref:Universal stress protein n=1 Tax=Micromonospora sonneratiae TaxID=1184706 RepID=A0ABW3Y9L7_9ACTN